MQSLIFSIAGLNFVLSPGFRYNRFNPQSFGVSALMGKILLLAIAVWLLLSVLKRYRNSLETPTKQSPAAEDMVQCASCGLHLPKTDSIQKNGHYYCCTAHSNESGS